MFSRSRAVRSEPASSSAEHRGADRSRLGALLPRALVALVLFPLIASPRAAAAQPAQAPDAAACIADHEAAQVENAAGRLREALRLSRSCALSTCPELVRGYCAKLTDEYARQVPTVSLRARDAGGCDTTDARVFVDGNLIAERLDGHALALDPGKRVVRVEVAGVEPEEQTIVATRGEQARTLRFGEARSSRCGAPPVAEPKPASPLPPPADQSDGLSTVTVAGIVVGSIGLAALATAGGLGIAGLTQRSDLEACKPCTQEEVDDVHRLFVVGDVFLAVGGAAAISSVVMLIVGSQSPSAGAPAASGRVSLRVGPLGGAVEGRFW